MIRNMNMIEGSILVVVACVSLLSSTVTGDIVNTQCSPAGHCYYLHTPIEGTVTWSEAYEECQKTDNRRLAVLDDVTLPGSMFMAAGEGEVWVAGRRATTERDRNWSFRTDRTEMLDGSANNKYCGKLEKNSRTLKSSKCTDTHRVICQYEVESQDLSATECQPINNDECLMTSPEKMTWFEAYDYCKTFHEGELAFDVHDTAELKELMGGTEEVQDVESHYWVGLQRMPWVWRTQQGDQRVDGFQFGDNEGSDNLNPACMTIRSDTNAKGSYWADRQCDDGLRYFLCETTRYDGDMDVSSESDESPTLAGSEDPNVPNTAPNTADNTVVIASAITVIGVTSVVTALVFLYVRRRRLEKAHRASRNRRVSHVTNPDGDYDQPDTTRVDRPRISAPITMDAPYPVSGYANLGPLIPVTKNGEGEAGEGEYSEIPIDRPPQTGIQTIYGNLFNDSNIPYATTVNFAEALPGERASVHHTSAQNGDPYALVRQKSGIENSLVENALYHQKMQQVNS